MLLLPYGSVPPPTVAAPASLLGRGRLAASESVQFPRSAALPGQGVLSAADYAQFARTGALPGTGVASAATVPSPTFDAVGAGNTSSSTPSTLAENHVISGNLVVVAIMTFAFQIATCKVGTTSMTSLGSVADDNISSDGGVQLLYLINPPTGSQTITASWATAPTDAAINSISVYNYHSGTSAQTTFGTGALSQSVTSATNGLILQAFTAYSLGGSGGITTYNQTQKYSASLGSQISIVFGYARGAATVSFTATASGTPDWAGIAMAVT